MENKLIIAGAAFVDNYQNILEIAQDHDTEIYFLENKKMYSTIPTELRQYVICSENLTNAFNYPVIPLNEFWVTQSIKQNVSNISSNALKASRSKFFLSHCLKENKLPYISRSYLKNMNESDIPKKFIARADCAYSSYGIVRYDEILDISKENIKNAVLKDIPTELNYVLEEPLDNVVIEDYIIGIEYSADVFIKNNNINILRLSRKKNHWEKGKPICDLYITIPITPTLERVINNWCRVLFEPTNLSFAQFDFIMNDDGVFLLDFSCRLGGGLKSLRDFSNIDNYIGNALFMKKIKLPDYSTQKNLVTTEKGIIETYKLDLSSLKDIKLYLFHLSN